MPSTCRKGGGRGVRGGQGGGGEWGRALRTQHLSEYEGPREERMELWEGELAIEGNLGGWDAEGCVSFS